MMSKTGWHWREFWTLNFKMLQSLRRQCFIKVKFISNTNCTNTVAHDPDYISDGTHSYSSVLFYGHELSLTIFDLMVFLFVDLFAEDYLLAGIVTFLVGEVK